MTRAIKRLILLALGIAIVVAAPAAWLRLPPAYNPLAPLDVRDPVTFVTGMKLYRIRYDGGFCATSLARTGLTHSPVSDRSEEDGCVVEKASRVSRGELALSTPFVATCPLAVSYAMFERHVVQPAARQHLGQTVTGVAHLGSYSCRDVRGGTRRSEHATANALDVAGFTLVNGDSVSVARDWPAGRNASPFIRAVHAGACRFFGSVLGPEYDAAHRDHLHLGMRGFSFCR